MTDTLMRGTSVKIVSYENARPFARCVLGESLKHCYREWEGYIRTNNELPGHRGTIIKNLHFHNYGDQVLIASDDPEIKTVRWVDANRIEPFTSDEGRPIQVGDVLQVQRGSYGIAPADCGKYMEVTEIINSRRLGVRPWENTTYMNNRPFQNGVQTISFLQEWSDIYSYVRLIPPPEYNPEDVAIKHGFKVGDKAFNEAWENYNKEKENTKMVKLENMAEDNVIAAIMEEQIKSDADEARAARYEVVKYHNERNRIAAERKELNAAEKEMKKTFKLVIDLEKKAATKLKAIRKKAEDVATK